ncbi:MAG: hypothetical protein JRI25_05410 [Deltaproteobacteria bacterium]|nr:hypothetical protein [Deltaproteobacteria bacterium]MBW2254020.1 hypothetical protein [Deltaproteobacteria bacterium]
MAQMRALLLLLLLSLFGGARAEVVDRVMYVVEDQLVLQSDVQLNAAINPLDASPSPFWSRPGADPEQQMVDAAILRHLAGNVALYQPSDDEVRTRTEAIRARFLDRASWQVFLEGWGLDERSFRSVIRRRMVVERYLARNLRADPADPEEWWAATTAVLEEVRVRVRIRRVELRGETATGEE